MDRLINQLFVPPSRPTQPPHLLLQLESRSRSGGVDISRSPFGRLRPAETCDTRHRTLGDKKIYRHPCALSSRNVSLSTLRLPLIVRPIYSPAFRMSETADTPPSPARFESYRLMQLFFIVVVSHSGSNDYVRTAGEQATTTISTASRSDASLGRVEAGSRDDTRHPVSLPRRNHRVALARARDQTL